MPALYGIDVRCGKYKDLTRGSRGSWRGADAVKIVPLGPMWVQDWRQTISRRLKRQVLNGKWMCTTEPEQRRALAAHSEYGWARCTNTHRWPRRIDGRIMHESGASFTKIATPSYLQFIVQSTSHPRGQLDDVESKLKKKVASEESTPVGLRRREGWRCVV